MRLPAKRRGRARTGSRARRVGAGAERRAETGRPRGARASPRPAAVVVSPPGMRRGRRRAPDDAGEAPLQQALPARGGTAPPARIAARAAARRTQHLCRSTRQWLCTRAGAANTPRRLAGGRNCAHQHPLARRAGHCAGRSWTPGPTAGPSKNATRRALPRSARRKSPLVRSSRRGPERPG